MILLASTSRTRQTLLANAGIDFRASAPSVDERSLVANNPQWNARLVSRQLAKAKAVAVSAQNLDIPVIGADQVLSIEEELLNKPKDLQDCRQQLLELRGRVHTLISTACCAYRGTEIWSCTQVATLKMRTFSEAFLDDYLATASETAMISVGGYQLERTGVQLFDTIEGDYFVILGLPLIPLLHHLRFIGAIPS